MKTHAITATTDYVEPTAMPRIYREHRLLPALRPDAEANFEPVGEDLARLVRRHFTVEDGYTVDQQDRQHRREREREIRVKRGPFTGTLRWRIEPLQLMDRADRGALVLLDVDPETTGGIAKIGNECDRILRAMAASGTLVGGLLLIMALTTAGLFDMILIPLVFITSLIVSCVVAFRLGAWLRRNRLEPYLYDEQLIEIQSHWADFIHDLRTDPATKPLVDPADGGDG